MFKFLILTVLVVSALSVPLPDTDGDAAGAAADTTAEGKPDLEGRFGGGYYPGGHGGYGGYPGGYGGYGHGYPGGYHQPYGGGFQASGSQAQASASSQNFNLGGGGFIPYGK